MSPTKSLGSCLIGTIKIVEVLKVIGLVTVIAVGYVSMHHGYPFIFSISSDQGLAILSHSRRINTMNVHNPLTREKRYAEEGGRHFHARKDAQSQRDRRIQDQRRRYPRSTTEEQRSEAESTIQTPTEHPTTIALTINTEPRIENPQTSTAPLEEPMAELRVGRKSADGRGVAEYQNRIHYPENLVSCDETTPAVSYAAPHLEHCLHKPDSDGRISTTRLTVYKVNPEEWQSEACWCTAVTTRKTCSTAFFGGKTKTKEIRRSGVPESSCGNACKTMSGSNQRIITIGNVGDWDCNWLSTTTKTYYVLTAQKIQVHLDTQQEHVMTPSPPQEPCNRDSGVCYLEDGGVLMDFSFPDSERCRLIEWMTATCMWSNTWNVEGFSCPQQGLSFTFSRPYHEYDCKGETLIMSDQGHLVSAGWFNHMVDFDKKEIENWTPRIHMSSDLSAAGDEYLVEQLNAYNVDDARRELEMMCERRNRDILTARVIAQTSGKAAVRLMTGRNDITGQVVGGIMQISSCSQYSLIEVVPKENNTEDTRCSHRWPVLVKDNENTTKEMYYDNRDGELYINDDRYTCVTKQPFWFPGVNDTVVDLNNPSHVKSLYDNDYHRFGAIGHPLLSKINRTSLFSQNEVLFSQSVIEDQRQFRDYMYHRDVAMFGVSEAKDPGASRKSSLSEGETEVFRDRVGLGWLSTPLGWLSARIGGLFGSIGSILCIGLIILMVILLSKPVGKTLTKSKKVTKTPVKMDFDTKKKTTSGVMNRRANERPAENIEMKVLDTMT